MNPSYPIAATLAGVLVLGPAWLAWRGRRERRSDTHARSPLPPWRECLRSLLAYVLAFNLTFLLQELGLVLPKALTPGLRPTLFHNNHRWEGEHPLAALFQGTGALTTLLVGLGCLWLLRRGAGRTRNTRLWLVWMAYCGALMALPQFAVGALHPGNDVGMAMQWLGWSPMARALAGVLALIAIAPITLALLPSLLSVATDPAQIATARARSRYVLAMAVVPALVAVVPLIAFRVPREWIEVLVLPLLVALLGIVWLQAGAWRAQAMSNAGLRDGSLPALLLATLALLALFQGVLRNGVAFY